MSLRPLATARDLRECSAFASSAKALRGAGPVLACLFALSSRPTVALAQFDVQIERGAVEVPRGSLFIENLDAVWTGAGKVLNRVSILIRDGVIRGIGADVTRPAGVPVLRGAGLTAIPGIVDAHAHDAQGGGASSLGSINEGTAVLTPELRVIDALDPNDGDIYQALSGGVTTAQILHGSSNPIGGQSAIIKMRWRSGDSRKLLFQRAPKTVKFALGQNVTRKDRDGPGPRRYPLSRMEVEQVFVQAFTAAKAYGEEWERYRQNPTAFRVPPRRDLRLEALVDILEGRVLVQAHSYRADEIVVLMRVAERLGFKIDVFHHGLEAYKVADQLAAYRGSVTTFADWWAYKLEVWDAIPYNAAILHQRGVLTSLNTDQTSLQPIILYEMMKPVKYGGVSKEDALRMVTLYPAKQLHIDDRIGSIEVGKDADLVLLNGDPFDVYSRVEKTIIDGIIYYDREREEETRGQPVKRFPAITQAAAASARGKGNRKSERAVGGTDERSSNGRGRQAAPVVALIGGTVHPVSAPDISNGVVLIKEDRIEAVGSASQMTIPPEATRIDVSGKHVYPGMIDPVTNLGLVGIGDVDVAHDDRTVGQFSPHLRAVAAVDPHSELIPVARVNGITAVLTRPKTGIVQATGSVIQLKGAAPDEMAIRDRAALMVRFPSPSGNWWDEPKLEGKELEELVKLFERAALYAKAPGVRDEPTDPFDPNVWGGDAVLLATMVPAVTGRIPVIFEVRRERDIRTLFLLLDRFPDVKAVMAGGDQAFRVAEELRRRQIPVIVGSALSPTLDWEERAEPVTAGAMNAAILHQAGVKLAFGTIGTSYGADEGWNVRNLPYQAARSVAFGLPKDVALRGVTLSSAEILALGEEMGSIEPGKRADLIVTTGDPLQILTQVQRVFIGGEEIPLESKHTRLWKQFAGNR